MLLTLQWNLERNNFVELLLTILLGTSIEQCGTATKTGRNCAYDVQRKEGADKQLVDRQPKNHFRLL